MKIRVHVFVFFMTLFITFFSSASCLKFFSFPVEETTPEDISFIIIDLKYNNNQIKILEFGEGQRSCFLGYDKLYGLGMMWANFWRYLSTFNLPFWYVGPSLIQNVRYGKMATHIFELNKGQYVEFLGCLQSNNYFKKTEEGNMKTSNIIVMKKNRMVSDKMLKKFRKQHSKTLFVNSHTGPHVSNKYKTSCLFRDNADLQQYVPKTKRYKKGFSKQLIETINQDFAQHNRLVIKPESSANGWGIIIFDKKDLEETLITIFNTDKKKLKKSDNDSYCWWGKEDNKTFLVQEFVTSKKLAIKGKEYDPTMRVVCGLSCKDNNMSGHFLGWYWKLPAHDLSEDVSLTNRYKSKVSEDHVSSVSVEEIDILSVINILSKIIPTIYLSILRIYF